MLAMAKDPRPIPGKVVLVTGAARGIGEAIASSLALRGAKVAIGDIDAHAARAAAQQIGHGVIGLPLDVTSEDSFMAFVEAAVELLGPIDILVNNAGVMWVGAHGDEPEAIAKRQFDVNFHGVARGMKIVIPRMLARGGGHVINIASAASKVTVAGEATYAATKHAVYGYSTSVRHELAKSPVEITVVMPVVVATELAAGTSSGGVPPLVPQDVADAVVEVIEYPKAEVFVPGRVNFLTRLMAILPERGRAFMHSRLVPNQITASDDSQRRSYESRIFG